MSSIPRYVNRYQVWFCNFDASYYFDSLSEARNFAKRCGWQHVIRDRLTDTYVS
jgi:hypothetical protein